MLLSKKLFTVLSLSLLGLGSIAKASLIPTAPTINARAYALLDFNSGHFLAQKNISERVEPASLTKMMTAYVVMHEIENGGIKLDDETVVSEKAWRMKGSRMFIKVDTKVTIKELLLGMIIQSGNDASVALAEHTAGSEDSFATLMNKYAEQLGMKNSNFVNSTGWPNKEHYTTVEDLAILSRALINDFPEHYALYKIKNYTYNNIPQFNRNRLLWVDDRVDGIKTGHTESAGYCLISSALKNDMRLIAIVVGTKSERARETASRKLLNYGFRFFETFKLHAANAPLTDMRIWKGEKESVPLGLTKTLYITTPRGKRNKIKAHMKVDATIVAPVTKGQPYGKVEVKLGDELIAERSLVALEDVNEGGFWRRTVDNIKLLFQ
ncbi:D-alanyl-D-alanine carboxypeptidase [hydrothermal vent metagenome]|uniref:serine-type D-Ala-D-Ala carboxypeptidase n=1 Tax=hydrothermal vent metagenome TaxID=652676 RepID=A0A3B1A177_9ZZZZ